MTEFERKIGYKFNNIAYLENALTHSSYANDYDTKDNERLEFLGDSVLSLIVSETLYLSHKDDDEGDLSMTRAEFVCEKGLFELSKKIDLANYIKLSNGQERTGARQRPSIISDAFEAVLAAIFLDSDFETAKKWLLGLIGDDLKNAEPKQMTKDNKTMLQEKLQKRGSYKITYKKISESGPDHDKSFVCAVLIDGNQVAEGSGKSKKTAEQNAAKKALEKI